MVYLTMHFVLVMLCVIGVTVGAPPDSVGNVVNCPKGQALLGGLCREAWGRVQPYQTLPNSVNAAQPSGNLGISWQLLNQMNPFYNHYQYPNRPQGNNEVNNRPDVIPPLFNINHEQYHIITNEDKDFEAKNVVTVPPNCPNGQEYINGQCRDVWPMHQRDFKNVVTVPSNCPNGQVLVNGQCREVWPTGHSRGFEANNVVTVPSNCPNGQVLVNGQCREVWPYLHSRDFETKNVVTVPPNCPDGQEYINGQCRDVWPIRHIRISDDLSAFLKAVALRTYNQMVEKHTSRNIINIPNQCPSGYAPDALGVCRQIFG